MKASCERSRSRHRWQSWLPHLRLPLIEALEPPQNRKRGDDFSVIEYIQDVDPELKEREIKNTLRAIEQKLRGGT